ncbi:MAG: hypothetical protein HXX18_06740 [Bacteroidetes bacterium]|nr:hypothetical protein [Bacteroidota bacterium]
MKKSILIIIIITTIFAKLSFSQGRETFGEYEDSLALLGDIMRNGENERVKFEANEKFIELLEDALNKKKSFDYPFDSIKTIARLISPDKRFKLFNWVIAKLDGTFDYYAFIQLYNENKKKYDILKLTDKSNDIIAPELQILDANNWYGALYYKIIHTQNKDVDYYTLLGWNGNNGMSFKKLIEVLSFRAGNKPIFGASIFKRGKDKPKRIIFEYSAKAIMNLKYDNQEYQEKVRFKKPKNGKRFEMVSIKSSMILFDRLVPLSPSLEGQKQFYVPETNIYDAFIYENGKWDFIEDVDARNHSKPSSIDRSKREPEHNLYTPK